ncbi:LuxR C-terminal-related transcriptional regulator [Chryseobacterium sp. KACC 21268]|nr:LuxR C-terminal-related transcriptional regulator [Chryseobacterium sp. KACC 21268]
MKLKFYSFFFTICSVFLFSQSLNFNELEKTIYRNNQLGKHQVSQQKLLDVLKSADLELTDQVKVNLLLAKTFRSINDYATSINYLERAQTLSKNLTSQDSLKMDIKAELAFATFDDHNYREAAKIMQQVASEKYKNLPKDSKAYLIMQEAYINFLQKNYDRAEIQYRTSLAILKEISPCNLPPVLVKQMQLYGEKKEFEKMELTYRQVLRKADSCSILKYKIYATEEIQNVYKANKMVGKAFTASKLLDSLKLIAGREDNLSEMHVENETFLQQQNQEEKDYSFRNTIIFTILLVILIGFGMYFFRKSTVHKKEKEKFELELIQMKEVLKVYSQQQFSNDNTNNSILKTELLNERQKQLLELMSEGLSNKEIADKLFISENTVKYHIKNIYVILDLKDRKDLLTKIKK